MYTIEPETSKTFKGFRPCVKTAAEGKIVYLAGVFYKDEATAEAQAEIYITFYLTHGEIIANKKVAEFAKKNLSKVFK